MTKLRFLANDEIQELSSLVYRDVDECPTCGSRLQEEDWWYDRTPGTYKLDGMSHRCNCDEQILLYKHYALARIPGQYMRLDWDRDYHGPDEVKREVNDYIARWDSAKALGMGIELRGRGLGTGKTFAATHIAKALVKRNERVFFIEFRDAVSDLDELTSRLEVVPVLILDEVVEAVTTKQDAYYRNILEDLIRHRTNHDLVTIMTTNLTDKELTSTYPRIYSLLKPKQKLIEMNGEDYRKDQMALRNRELFENDERLPIT